MAHVHFGANKFGFKTFYVFFLTQNAQTVSIMETVLILFRVQPVANWYGKYAQTFEATIRA